MYVQLNNGSFFVSFHIDDYLAFLFGWKPVVLLNFLTSIIFVFDNQKNAMIAGALTGALTSAVTSGEKDKIVLDALTGGAVATAAEFINYLTY